MSKQKNTKNISAEALKVTLKKKKESNAKAQAIVESWIEGAVCEDDLINNLYYINQDHFQDVIEERAILKYCGYPLCAKKLKNIPAKQYQISTQLNKVFDIIDRKNFCSNLCYKAAKYLKDQLLTSPLWLRCEKETVNFKLLCPDTTRGSSGIEVDLGHPSPVKPAPEEFTSILKFTTESLSKFSENFEDDETNQEKNESKKKDFKKEENTFIKNNVDIPSKYKKTDHFNMNKLQTKFNSNMLDIKVSHDIEDKNVMEKSNHLSEIVSNELPISVKTSDKLMANNETEKVVNNFNKTIDSISDNNHQSGSVLDTSSVETSDCKNITHRSKIKHNIKKRKEKSSKEIPQKVNFVIHIEQSLRQWFTIDTFSFILGEEKVKELLKDKGESLKEYQRLEGGTAIDPQLYERYLMICRKLNILELEDSKYDTEAKESLQVPQKPLPDYSVLKAETKEIEIKVKSFYKGDKAVSFTEDTSKLMKEEERPSVLPLVDLHAQKALRRRIVLDKLTRIMSDLGQILGLKNCYSTQEVRHLISTFNLSANNVTYKPMEWNLIALVIFKVLSIRNKSLQQALHSETSSKNTTLLLLSYQIDGGYLERLVSWLIDIDYILSNKNS